MIILHLGERYDVLVTADHHTEGSIGGASSNFYIRAQSLEGDLDAQVVMGDGQHVALGVLRYHATSTSADAAPTNESVVSNGGLTLPSSAERHEQTGERGAYEYVSNVTGKTVTILNCFDVATPASDGGPSSCVPVTALTTHAKWRPHYDALVGSPPDETHEVAFSNTRGPQYAHFTRVSPNVSEPTHPSKENHRGPGPRGEVYTQFVKPGRPMYEGTEVSTHNHSLFLDINHGNRVQIAWNHESRTAHPIHIHGYKFVVAAIHEARLLATCAYPLDPPLLALAHMHKISCCFCLDPPALLLSRPARHLIICATLGLYEPRAHARRLRSVVARLQTAQSPKIGFHGRPTRRKSRQQFRRASMLSRTRSTCHLVGTS